MPAVARNLDSTESLDVLSFAAGEGFSASRSPGLGRRGAIAPTRIGGRAGRCIHLG